MLPNSADLAYTAATTPTKQCDDGAARIWLLKVPQLDGRVVTFTSLPIGQAKLLDLARRVWIKCFKPIRRPNNKCNVVKTEGDATRNWINIEGDRVVGDVELSIDCSDELAVKG